VQGANPTRGILLARTHFEVLGFDTDSLGVRDISDADVRAAYRRMALRCHPDKCQDLGAQTGRVGLALFSPRYVARILQVNTVHAADARVHPVRHRHVARHRRVLRVEQALASAVSHRGHTITFKQFNYCQTLLD
jgi:hypothetical protein